MTAVIEEHIDHLLDNLDDHQKLSLYKRLRSWYAAQVEDIPKVQSKHKPKAIQVTPQQKKVNDVLENFAIGLLRYSIRHR